MFPTFVANEQRSLVNSQRQFPIKVYVGMDNVVYKEEVLSLALETDLTTWTPLLLLVPLRLGVDNLNPLYYDAIKACFRSKFTVGIAGYVLLSK
jgi:cysteine protease ATG4